MPFGVVFRTVDFALRHFLKDVARTRQVRAIVPCPKSGTYQCAGALRVDFRDLDHDHCCRLFSVSLKGCPQIGIVGQSRAPVDPHYRIRSGNHEHERYASVRNDIPQAVEPIVAAPIRHRQRAGIDFPHNRPVIPARACIRAFKTNRRQDAEPRGHNPTPVERCEPPRDLALCRCTRRPVKTFQRLYIFNEPHLDQTPLLASMRRIGFPPRLQDVP